VFASEVGDEGKELDALTAIVDPASTRAVHAEVPGAIMEGDPNLPQRRLGG